MKTSHGVVQGYTGVAAVDNKHQVIIHAQAHGQGQERDLLEPTHQHLKLSKREIEQTKITADSGYHNKKALEYLQAHRLDGYIADTGFRSRDPRFNTFERHKPKSRLKPENKFTVDDFNVSMKNQTCSCPAGKTMWLKCKDGKIGNQRFMQFRADEHDCPACPLKKQCLRTPGQQTPGQVNVKLGITEAKRTGVIEQMKQKIDSAMGRAIYSQRLGTVEPVFGNITENIGIKRFTLRGKRKVNVQWQLMAMIHNIFKIYRYGWQW